MIILNELGKLLKSPATANKGCVDNRFYFIMGFVFKSLHISIEVNFVRVHYIHCMLKFYKLKLLGKLVVRYMVLEPCLVGGHVFEP